MHAVGTAQPQGKTKRVWECPRNLYCLDYRLDNGPMEEDMKSFDLL